MNEKLKELSKFCCEPKSLAEFIAVKLAAEKGGIKSHNCSYSRSHRYFKFHWRTYELGLYLKDGIKETKLIPVHEYCELLMKDESEFDRMVNLAKEEDHLFHRSNDDKSFVAEKGYHWEIKGNEVSLVKD